MQTLTFTEFKKRYDVNFKAQKGDIDFVGQGGYGNVYLGRNIKQHIDVAIKRSPTDKKLLDEVERGKVVPEHPNIARYIEGFRVDGESEDFDVAILQYYPHGNLDQLVAKCKLSESQLDDILRGILEGLQFLHEGFKEKKGNKISIIHRDLKPQNILISEYKGVFTPLISDFGISKTVYQDENDTGGSIEQSGDAGTIVYKAPEQIKGGKIRTNLDFWAFGVMLFKILKRKLPFYSTAHPSTDAFKNEVMKKITDADLNDIFTQLTDQPQKYQDIIKRCLVRDNKERVQTAAELIDILDGIPQRLEHFKDKKNENEEKTDVIVSESIDDKNVEAEDTWLPVSKPNLGLNKTIKWLIITVLLLISSILIIVNLFVYEGATNLSVYVDYEKAVQLKDDDMDLRIVGVPIKSSFKNKHFGNILKRIESDSTKYAFIMRDTKNKEFVVLYTKPKPQDFDHADKVVVVGKWNQEFDCFEASHILLKCPSKYTDINFDYSIPK